MAQSGLQYQTIQSLFYKYHSLTAMTWIRRRREIAQAVEGRRRRSSISLNARPVQDIVHLIAR
jgi:hypothetical protein